MGTKTHAEKELEILLETTPDAIIRDFVPEIIAICEAFGKSGQSGGSAPYTASALSQAVKKLCLQQTIAPLTGGDDEWVCGGMLGGECQNNRLSSVFKGKNGKAHYLDAIVFKGEEEHDTFTGSLRFADIGRVWSRQYIKSFPFTPKTFYIDVVKDYDCEKYPEEDVFNVGENNKYAYKIKDPKQLEEVYEYYDKYEI